MKLKIKNDIPFEYCVMLGSGWLLVSLLACAAAAGYFFLLFSFPINFILFQYNTGSSSSATKKEFHSHSDLALVEVKVHGERKKISKCEVARLWDQLSITLDRERRSAHEWEEVAVVVGRPMSLGISWRKWERLARRAISRGSRLCRDRNIKKKKLSDCGELKLTTRLPYYFIGALFHRHQVDYSLLFDFHFFFLCIKKELSELRNIIRH